MLKIIKLKILNSILISFILALIISCNGSPQLEKEEPIAKIPSYEIEFPEATGRFENLHTKVPNQLFTGDTIHNWILQGIDDNGSYLYYVTYHRLSEKQKTYFKSNPIEKINFYMGALTSASTKMGGKNISFDKVKLDEVIGLEGKCDVFDGDGILFTRCFMKDEHVFALGAGGKQVEKSKVLAFLNSFDTKFE